MPRFFQIALKKGGAVITGNEALLSRLQHQLARKHETFFSPQGLEVRRTYDNSTPQNKFLAEVKKAVQTECSSPVTKP